MSATLSILTDGNLEAALKERAQADGTTISELAREILTRALLEPPLATRVGHLKGKLDLPEDDHDSWRQELQSRNWRA